MILAIVVSSASFVTRTCIAPSSFNVPANTSSPRTLWTGTDSPVIAAWLTEESPWITSPSIAIFCPGLIKITSSIRKSSTSTSNSLLPRSTIAVVGAISINDVMEFLALSME